MRRLDLERLASRFGGTLVYVLFGAVSSAVSLLVVAVAAWVSDQPLIFPSLASTAFLVFNRPRSEAAAPRSIVVGHSVGIAGGEAGLVVAGLVDRGAALERLTAPRLLAIAVAVVVTTSAMLVLRAPHPPAAATALLIALGLITSLAELVALGVGVVVLVVQGYLIDRVVGLDYPAWARKTSRQRE